MLLGCLVADMGVAARTTPLAWLWAMGLGSAQSLLATCKLARAPAAGSKNTRLLDELEKFLLSLKCRKGGLAGLQKECALAKPSLHPNPSFSAVGLAFVNVF